MWIVTAMLGKRKVKVYWAGNGWTEDLHEAVQYGEPSTAARAVVFGHEKPIMVHSIKAVDFDEMPHEEKLGKNYIYLQ